MFGSQTHLVIYVHLNTVNECEVNITKIECDTIRFFLYIYRMFVVMYNAIWDVICPTENVKWDTPQKMKPVPVLQFLLN